MSTPVTDRLPATSVLRLLAVLVFVIGPHFLRIPIWASGLVIAIVIWRGSVALRGLTLLSNWFRIPLTLVAFFGVYIHYGTLNGQNPGVALLIVMSALKLTEMGARRDYTIVLFLAYFLIITHFLFSQEIVMLLYLFPATLLVTAVFLEINHPQGPLPIKVLARRSGVMVAQGVPVMLVFFLLFPRIPGPIWGLPNDAGAAFSGLSDSMTPGSIAQLSQSDEVAFRVVFEGALPARGLLYWRGPVFWGFDGQTWDAGFKFNDLREPVLEVRGEPVRYETVLEPHGEKWLLALDMPGGSPPADVRFGVDYQMLSRHPVIDRRLLRLESFTDYRLDAQQLEPRQRVLALRLPAGTNPRTRELIDGWRAQGASDGEMVQRALLHFREQPFSYTLTPPLLAGGRNSTDDFLFRTRSGFCEHYASAFTVMMRLAGIPARVVTGYQGGELHEAGGYLIVRQSDAHAWSEVWLAGRGWVRIDPTAAVSPNRIDLGLGGALPQDATVPGLARLNRGLIEAVQLRWDMINAGWNRWVLAYGPQLQREFMRYLGFADMRQMILALAVICVAILAAVSGWMLWQVRPAHAADPVWQDWQRFRRKLARRGIEFRPSEGPRDLGDRITAESPQLAGAAGPIVDLYVRLRYGRDRDALLESQLRKRVRKFPEPV